MLLRQPILLLLLSLSIVSRAQDNDDSATIEKAYRNSQMSYLALAGSYAARKDTAKVRAYLMKVNPYQLLYQWNNTTAPDTFLWRYPLGNGAREEIAKKYLDVLNGPKSPAYTSFNQMADEDQHLRYITEHTDDESTIQSMRRKIHLSDSTHAAYLYSYVKQNGWPTLENGSMPATLLAIHDHRNHEFYLPYLKKAVMNGQADINALWLIKYWISSGRSDIALQEMLDTSKKIAFDVSSMLNDRLPSSMQRIVKAVQKYCGQHFKTYLLLETPKNEIFAKWVGKREYSGKKHIISQFVSELANGCPRKFESGLWAVHFSPAARTKMTFYIVFEQQ